MKPAPAPARPRRREGFAVGSDGTALYFRVHHPARESSHLPVVFTDGIGCDGYVWKYLEPELVRDRTIVHWHFRGHGKSAVPSDPERVTISDSADDLAAVLDAAGVDRAILAGHSMGVQVCLEAWRRHADRVAGLVLLCGSYGNPLRTFKGKRTLEDVLPLVRFAIHRIPRLVTAFWRRAIPTDFAYQMATLTEINGPLVRRDDFFPYLEHIGSIDLRLFVDMLAAAGRHTAREILHLIDVPTLIIAGDRDGFTPIGLSEEMHRTIPGAALHVVADGSHTAPIEKPGEVTDVVARFVRGLAGLMALERRKLPAPLVWTFRLASLGMVVGGIVLAWTKFRPNEEQAELTRYVELEVPLYLERERAVYDRLDRLSNSPGPTAVEARALLVDDVIPRLIALRKLAASVVVRAPSAHAINDEYLAAVDKLLDACRFSVRTIDEPTGSTEEAHKSVRQRFYDAGQASRAWSAHLADTCKRAGLTPPPPSPKK